MKYIKFITSLRPKNELFYVIFFLILSTFFEFLFVSLVPYLLNNLVNEKSNFSFFNFVFDKPDVIFYVLLIIFSFFLIKNLFFFLNQFFFYKYSFKISDTLCSYLFRKYITEKYQLFINSSSSLFLNKILNNVESVRLFITNGLTFVSEILVFIGLSVIVFYNSTSTSLLVIAFIGIFSLFYIFFSRNLASSWSKKKQLHEHLKIKYLQDGFGGFKELKLLNKEDSFIKSFSYQNVNANKLNLKFNLLYQFPRIYLEVVGAFGLILLISLNQPKEGPNLIFNALPLLALYFVVFIRLLPSVNRILNSIETYRYYLPILKIIYKDLKNFNNNTILTSKKFALPFKKKIFLKDLSFSFSKNKIVLKKTSLTIRKGNKIGIIGNSGIGKTTFVNLFTGFLKPNFGFISVDDKIISTKNMREWQKNISYIYQKTFIINDTIENNISFNSEKDFVHKERISEILKIKKFNNFINSFSRGINTLVGENGSKLSGGQIQIIGIARALYFNRNILICDEITNSLDKKSEKAVMKYIENLDKTIIIISHKLENLQFCDRIYTIKNSRLSLHKAR